MDTNLLDVVAVLTRERYQGDPGVAAIIPRPPSGLNLMVVMFRNQQVAALKLDSRGNVLVGTRNDPAARCYDPTYKRFPENLFEFLDALR
jgi:hypothetical protein